jgi:hypothetical protein
VTERQLSKILGGGDARRYGLVNRALKDGTLLRLKRGLYYLKSSNTGDSIHPFAVAQALLPGSYISFETALAFHHWIPEAVFTTASVTPGRKSLETDHESLGRFSHHPLAINDYQFLAAVARVKLGLHTALVASPLHALMDLVALRKESWTGLDWVEHSLRIDEARLATLRHKDFAALSPTYKHKAANEFLAHLEKAGFSRRSVNRIDQHHSKGRAS